MFMLFLIHLHVYICSCYCHLFIKFDAATKMQNANTACKSLNDFTSLLRKSGSSEIPLYYMYNNMRKTGLKR